MRTMQRLRSASVMIVSLLVAACATVPGSPGQSGEAARHANSPGIRSARRAAPERPNGPISREEVEASTQSDAYRLIYKARPGWLRARSLIGIGVHGVAPIQAYVDGMLVGSVEYLQQVPASVVDSVIFLNGIEATQRFGTDHGNGAVLVTTRS